MVVQQESSVWPTVKKYDAALLARHGTISDDDIRRGELLVDASGPIHLNEGAPGKGQGKFVCVYKVDGWVVRCLTGNPPFDLDARYRAIIAYSKSNADELPFLIPHEWINDAILIDGRKYPIIKAPYIPDSRPLGQFLHKNHQERSVVRSLASQWLSIVDRLESLQIAHGDLDVTNVLVCGTAPHVTLRLIDYDGMYIPTLAGRTLIDRGHRHFQPRQAGVRRFSPDMDRFSALVMYLSLLALAENPTLWEHCKADEDTRLLLGVDDFQQLAEGKVTAEGHFALLCRQGNTNLAACLNELQRSIEDGRMPVALPTLLQEQRAVHHPQALPIPVKRPDRPATRPKRREQPITQDNNVNTRAQTTGAPIVVVMANDSPSGRQSPSEPAMTVPLDSSNRTDLEVKQGSAAVWLVPGIVLLVIALLTSHYRYWLLLADATLVYALRKRAAVLLVMWGIVVVLFIVHAVVGLPLWIAL
jgi:hypothetical protein